MINEYQDLKNQAENLRKQRQFAQALPIYEKLWEQCGDNPDKWVGWGYAKCLKELGRPEDALEICRIVRRIDVDFKTNNDLAGWCIYEMGIKQSEDQFDQEKFDRAANAIVQITQQGEFSPYTLTVLTVVHRLEQERKDIENKKNLNSSDFKRIHNLNEQIVEWLEYLDVEQLPLQSNKKSDGSTYISYREDWYNSRAKALLALERHVECAEICANALAEVKDLHNGYDVWFRWYGAQSHVALGEYNKALVYLEYILQQKQDFWIRREYAKCLKETGELDEAIRQYALIALPHKGLGFRWEVYLDLGNMLAEAGDLENAKQHILLAVAIRRDEGWEKTPQGLQNALQTLDLVEADVPSAKTLHRQLQPFWKSMKPRPKTTHTGKIFTVHNNGKSGMILSDSGEKYFFGMRSFQGETDAEAGLRVRFNLKKVINRKTEQPELHAVDIIEE